MDNSPSRSDINHGVSRSSSNPHSNNNSNTDLDQQAHQDALFFESETNTINTTPAQISASSASQRRRATTVNLSRHDTPDRQQSSAAATRFYRQHRNLSDASVDSAGGAYIDHRRPQASPSTNMRATGVASGGGEAGERGNRHLEGYSTMGGSSHNRGDASSGLQRTATGENNNRRSIVRGQEERDHDGADGAPTSPRSFSTSPSRDEFGSSFSARTTRQQQHRSNSARDTFSTADLDEHAVDEEYDHDEEDDTGDYPDRHRRLSSSRTEINTHIQPPRSNYSDQISRPGSANGKAEEDVCFPVNGAEVDLLDLGMNSMGMGMGMGMGGMPTPNDHEHERHHGIGLPGVTSNFPFPFDFEALEDFADREKEKIPLSGTGKRAKFTNKDDSATTGVRGRGMGGRGTVDAAVAKSMRQRKLSESVAPGRFQRKLALFEGGSTGLEPLAPRGIIDATSPLLAPSNGRITGGDGYGANPNDGKSAGAARPYRFSFYSNALASTIHARSLAEIPAEGQTFEELFVGRPSPPPDLQDDENYADDVRTAFSPPPPTSISQLGTDTPTGQHSSRASLSGAGKPPGFAGNTHGNQQANNMGQMPKSQPGRMRSDMDAESNTWWLDVLCPTDQEMKVLSKVSLARSSLFAPSILTSTPYSLCTRYLVYIRLQRKTFKWKKREKKLNYSETTISFVSDRSNKIHIHQLI